MTLEQEYLTYLTARGVEERYGVPLTYDGTIVDEVTDAVRSRINHELETLEKAGFAGYFLIVADILRFCRERGIPTGPGRGSVCGSAVAYAIGITDVEPIRFGIPFERFLHLERIAQPDIDLDICQARRGEVIDYLRDTYGRDAVAQIITFTPMNAKGIVRDVCRVLHVDDILRGVKNNETGEKLAAMIPEGSGADQVKLQEFMESDEGKEFYTKIGALKVPYNGETISVLSTCLALEGLRRHGSVHAAGVVIADRPLIDIAPLYRKNKDAEVQVQFDMRDIETVGLLKMDVLGLRTVTVLGDAEKLVQRKHHGFSIKDVPLDDPATFALLAGGDTGAVFQLEGDGITAACTGMRPDRFEDIVALIALYRPGPMEQLGSYFRRKHGEEEVSYAFEELRPVLERTYGLMVYQEQVMNITRVLGGYTAGEADMFRKAIGKKLPELIKKEIAKFEDRAIANGYDEAKVRELGEQIFYFGRYGFNLGHATGYAFITYWTAYLKANHPVEFFAANLNSQIGNAEALGVLLQDAARHSISVRPPDINLSGAGFTVGADDSILFGLGAVKGLGDNRVVDIIEERDSPVKNVYRTERVTKLKPDGVTEYKANSTVVVRAPHTPSKFKGLWDFCARLTHIPVNAKRALVVAGAFGVDVNERSKMIAQLEDINAAAKKGKIVKPSDFDLDGPNEIEILREEREVMGFYISGHPLGYYKEDIARFDAVIDGTFESLPTNCTVAGMVMGIRTHHSKNGEMAWVTLETGISDIPDITIFSSVWGDIKDQVKKYEILVVSGKKEHHQQFGWGIKANHVRILDRSHQAADILHISIPDTDVTDLLALRDMESEDGALVQIAIETQGRVALISTSMTISPTGATLKDLESRGWKINIDPTDMNALAWPNGRLQATAQQFGGSGAERTPTWELPLVRTALRLFDGRVITEMKVV